MAKTSIVPYKYIDAHVNVVLEPVALILKVLNEASIRVAKDHCRPFILFLSVVFIVILGALLFQCLSAWHPVAVQLGPICSCEHDTLSLESELHLNSHLFKAAKEFVVKVPSKALPPCVLIRMTLQSMH